MNVNEASEELHNIFNSLPRFRFPFNSDNLCTDGIYILFEEDEDYSTKNRVVRVGTHIMQGRFIDRVNEHFSSKSQRSSIFRRHIGRCFLNNEDKPYLKYWNKRRSCQEVNIEYERVYEDRISEYIQNKLSFVIIKNVSSSQRKKLENAIIATIAQDTITAPSQRWLGRFHPDNRISGGKLWNIVGLRSEIIDDHQIEIIKRLSQ
jgi:hypothetical protein